MSKGIGNIRMTIKESLNILDTRAIDNNEKFLDLRNLYEAANLDYEKKKKLKELIDKNEDPEVIAAYIINDDDKLKEAIVEESRDYPGSRYGYEYEPLFFIIVDEESNPVDTFMGTETEVENYFKDNYDSSFAVQNVSKEKYFDTIDLIGMDKYYDEEIPFIDESLTEEKKSIADRINRTINESASIQALLQPSVDKNEYYVEVKFYDDYSSEDDFNEGESEKIHVWASNKKELENVLNNDAYVEWWDYVGREPDDENDLDESLTEAKKSDILNKIRNTSIPEGERLEVGDAKKGWTAVIDNHGVKIIDIYRNSSKLASGALGRIWKDRKLVKTFEGPLNVVRDNMIKYLSQTDFNESFNEDTKYRDLYFGGINFKLKDAEDKEMAKQLIDSTFDGRKDGKYFNIEGGYFKINKTKSGYLLKYYGNIGSIYYEEYFKDFIRKMKSAGIEITYEPKYSELELIFDRKDHIDSLDNEQKVQAFLNSKNESLNESDGSWEHFYNSDIPIYSGDEQEAMALGRKNRISNKPLMSKDEFLDYFLDDDLIGLAPGAKNNLYSLYKGAYNQRREFKDGRVFPALDESSSLDNDWEEYYDSDLQRRFYFISAPGGKGEITYQDNDGNGYYRCSVWLNRRTHKYRTFNITTSLKDAKDKVETLIDKYSDSKFDKSFKESFYLNEASYGGAFDIEDDQYFTRDDLDEFGYAIEEALNDKTDLPIFNYAGCWIDRDWLELTMECDGYEVSWHTKIDMRRIRTPRDLFRKYSAQAFDWFEKTITDYLKESLTEDTQDEVSNLKYKLRQCERTYGKSHPRCKKIRKEIDNLIKSSWKNDAESKGRKLLTTNKISSDIKKISGLNPVKISNYRAYGSYQVQPLIPGIQSTFIISFWKDQDKINMIVDELNNLGYKIIDTGKDFIEVEKDIEINKSLTEDTIKTKSGKWVNKGKEGTHGKFKTKKEADAQRKAMFANGYRESLDEDDLIEYYGDEISKKYNSGSQKKIDKWLDRRKVDSIGDLDLNGLRELAKYVGVKTKELDEAKIVEPKYRDGDVVFIGDALGYQGTFLIEGDFRNIPEELYANIRQIKKYGNTNDHFYLVEYNINSKHLFEEDYKKFFDYITPLLNTAGISIVDIDELAKRFK